MKNFHLTLLLFFCCSLWSCTSAIQKSVEKDISTMEKGPTDAPTKNITNFSDGLRCMDNMMINFGIHDVVALAEDLEDRTTKVQAGTKDMLISAVSDMSKRSRAIRLVAFGNDSGNLVSFLAAAGSQSAYNLIPPYDIRGSISQLDQDIVRKQADGAFAVEEFGMGASSSVGGSILGIDLSVLSTGDMSVMPGVTSRNSVTIFKSGAGSDADAEIRKAGINFSFFFSKSEGTAQALRNLVELASIELFGRLLKVPYWQCMGISPEQQEVKAEIEDWFYSMKGHNELVPYLKQQFRNRGYYEGEIDNEQTPEFKNAVVNYQKDLSLQPTGQADLAFFSAFLNGKVREYVAQVAQVVAAKPLPINVNITELSKASAFKPGDKLAINVNVNEDGFLYCFFIDESQHIQRFYPNRFSSDNFISAGKQIALPGTMPFDITASDKPETISCFATKKDVFDALPEPIRAADFENLNLASIEDVRKSIKNASGQRMGEGQFAIKLQ